MAKARPRPGSTEPRRLPRGRHALSAEEVLAAQRERLLAAVPGAVAERGYEAMTVADVVKRAGVSRNAFYKNFKDKHECFAIAQEAGHERLLETLTRSCEEGAAVEERVEASLAAALEALAADPEMARLLFVEAPSSVAEGIASRYHEWLRRYGTLLRPALPGASSAGGADAELEQVIVGGIATRIASEVLGGQATELPSLAPHLAEFVLTFFRPGHPEVGTGEVVALEPEQPPAGPLEEQSKQAGA